ncbi:MAG: glycosyltransferase [Chromatiales bacterium]|nr:glycosyltransferase [Chromatiales bacterium]
MALALAGASAWLVAWLLPFRPFLVRERLEPACLAALPGAQVTALVPARDEAGLIGENLAGLRAQHPALPIVVIDDQSGDGTAATARSACPNVTVISGSAPPAGWMGKLWALEQGLSAVNTPWVLLVDADIRLEPGVLSALWQRAQAGNSALVSVMVQLRMENVWERLLAPAFVYFFRLLYPFALVNGPDRRFAAAAGGCILLRVDALEAAGGFAALRDAVIDDCSLAAKVKAAGFGTWLGLTRAAHSLRPYGPASFWQMVVRSAWAQLGGSTLWLLLCTVGMLALFAGPLLLLGAEHPALRLAGLCGLLAMLASYVPVLQYYGLGAWRALTLPLVALGYLLMTWHSALRGWRGTRTIWKDRHYTAGDSS